MKTYTFADSAPGKLRADIHRGPVALNNGIIERLKINTKKKGTATLSEISTTLGDRETKSVGKILLSSSLRVGDIISLSIDPSITSEGYTALHLGITHISEQSHKIRANIFFGGVSGDPLVHEIIHHNYSGMGIKGVKQEVIPALYLPDEFMAAGDTGKRRRSVVTELIPGLNSKTQGVLIGHQDIKEVRVSKSGVMERIGSRIANGWNNFLEARKARVKIISTKRMAGRVRE